MLDFFTVCVKEPRGRSEVYEVYPDFIVKRSSDLMVQGSAFYAIWDETAGLWSRDEYDVVRLVDEILVAHAEKLTEEGMQCKVKLLGSFSNGKWKEFKAFLKNVSDNSKPLDQKLTFSNTEVKKSDHVSRRLPYSLTSGSIAGYDELVGVLYSPEERAKFEWAIGAIMSGEAKKIQKFLVFYGKGGTGKSTIMDIIFKLLGGLVKDGGYCATFEAKELVGNNSFSTESFRDGPLVAIQQDADLSKIEDNTKLNSIVSHDDMTINEKYKSTYSKKINAFLFIGTNKTVHITDAKSGLIRRLIEVNPTRITHDPDKYFELTAMVDFELGAIAQHCLDVYHKMGKNFYREYEPLIMMRNTNPFHNFIEAHYDIFKAQEEGTTLKQAWGLYKIFAEEAELSYKLQLHKFRDQLGNYFDEFHDRLKINGVIAQSVYKGFSISQFKTVVPGAKPLEFSLVMNETESILDELYAGLPAQYGTKAETPRLYWTDEERLVKGEMKKPRPSQVVSTVLGDLDTSKLHFIKVPEHHIVIDFDLEGDDGEKSLDRNLKAASIWPATYGEVSKSGKGVHLHYAYDGDPSELASVYSEGIEIKVYTGNGSLRRRLSKCNNVSISTLNSGLPFKEKKMLPKSTMQSEQGLRSLIAKNLRKEVHPGTKPSMDFIEHVLKQAYDSGVQYDVSDMMPKIMAFANNSQKNADYCLRVLARLDLKSKETSEDAGVDIRDEVDVADQRIVFFDCEVYPNLFVVCWKYLGGSSVIRMINPKPQEIEQLLKFKLVGFNNRSYDNHILWARMLGASIEDLYKLSQKIIVEKDNNAKFGQAYGLSYADVYDFSVKKQGLKKWEIELGIPHVEMDIPWDEPVQEKDILRVVDYCCNDVNALEVVFHHCAQDFAAREILSDLSSLPVNASTRQHAIKIILGNDQNPQKLFVYTDLSDLFPGYEFDPYNKTEKSTYKGEVVGEGGYVYAEPGMYEDVVLLDVASMHPTSIEELNLFGPYTKTYSEIKAARLAIRDSDTVRAKQLLGGKLAKYVEDFSSEDESNLKALSDALKLILNAIYGYTSATFDNPFRDKRNVDNIVAKRGALFMIDLKHAVQEQGFTVAHIKTDSIKIPNATLDIIEFVKEFGAQYGYTFDHEDTYRKMCLVNDAVYVAYVAAKEKNGRVVPEHWTATGAEFKHPYVFKSLFTGESITFKDLCETKQVKEGAMYLHFPGEGDIVYKNAPKSAYHPGEDDSHIGRSGLFVPINPNNTEIKGGELLRVKDGKKYAVTGTKGYLWAEENMVRQLHGDALDRMSFVRIEDDLEGTGGIGDLLDITYYEEMAEEAAETIQKFGDFEEFVS